jgi:putative endonuclease
MYYVYILKLRNNKYYIGLTKNINRRIKEHSKGLERTTKRFLPCSLVTYIVFSSKKKAIKFEKYLKTGSGFAFRNRHLV